MSDHKMGHVQSFKIYLLVFLSLLALTGITYWTALKIHFEVHLFNELLAMGIAALKASLVTLFFMHGKYENKLTWAFVVYPATILSILFCALYLDYGARRNGTQDTAFKIETPVIAQSSEHTGAAGHGAPSEHGATEHGATSEHGEATEHATPAEEHGTEANHAEEAAPAEEHGAAPADANGESHEAPAEAPPEGEPAPTP